MSPKITAYALRPIPLHRPAQSFPEIHNWAISQQFSGAADIGQRVADVARARRMICRFSFVTCQFTQNIKCLIERASRACGHVHHLAGDLLRRGFGSQQIGMNHVVNICKVAALFAVSVDSGLFPASIRRQKMASTPE